MGASVAGLKVAEGLRENSFDGEIVLIGDECHMPYDRPPLSKEALLGPKSTYDLQLLPTDGLDELDLDLRLGERAIGLRSREGVVDLHDGRLVAYDSLIIATGSTPRRLPIAHMPGMFYLRTIDDAAAIRTALLPGREVVIVGAGFIGLEVAASASALGARVTVVEATSTALSRSLPPDLADKIVSMHESNGVRFLFGRCIVGAQGGTWIEDVVLDDGTTLSADAVVIGIGSVPNDDWLAGSGLLTANGVVCDECLRACGAENVYAVGDVARWPSSRELGAQIRLEHWTSAVEQAMHVADQICGEPQAFDTVPYVWSHQFGQNIQIAGNLGPTDSVFASRGEVRDGQFVALLESDNVLRGALTVNAPQSLQLARRYLKHGSSPTEAAEHMNLAMLRR